MSNRTTKQTKNERKPQNTHSDYSKSGGRSKQKHASTKHNVNEWDDPTTSDNMLGSRGVSDSMQEPLVFESDKNK